MTLRMYNTLSGQKEEFVPLSPGKVKMYVCGVTVYDFCHIGHARAGVVFDIIYRYLKYLGFDVTYARNFTDIDDKIINRANEEKIPWTEVTAKYIRAFYEDMGALNIAAPSVEPKATEFIAEMVEMISRLIANGKAYEMGGDVYFSIKTFPPYGKLSGKNTDDLIAGARVDVDERKRDALDFALWKKSKPGEPFWESPWGPGRPGWHIECSAMGRKLLGEQFDIHGGGKDLVFPHHENEIAQSQGASGCAPVNYWIHNGFVNINKEKMSKSLGNFFTLRDIYKLYLPEVLRLFLLTVHYRSPIDFSTQNLDETVKALSRYYEFFAAAEKARGARAAGDAGLADKIKAHPFMEKFSAAMDDDFNSALAIAHMHDELRNLNKMLTELDGAKDDARWREFDIGYAALRLAGEKVLGLFIMTPDAFKEKVTKQKVDELQLDVERIEVLITERNAARKSKDWKKADACRDELSRMNIVLEDTAQGTIWKIK